MILEKIVDRVGRPRYSKESKNNVQKGRKRAELHKQEGRAYDRIHNYATLHEDKEGFLACEVYIYYT